MICSRTAGQESNNVRELADLGPRRVDRGEFVRRDPKVTVLLPVHNGEPYLSEAIDSILGQSFCDFELLIIDDGSTDRTSAIVESYRDPRIRLLRHPRNLGLVSTLNRGLAEAHGAYVARIDADDVCLPDRLQAQVAFLDRHPEVGVLGTAVQIVDPVGTAGATVRFPVSHAMARWALLFSSPIAHPAAMMRKDVITRLGGYRAEAVHCEDYDLWWRASDVTQLANLDKILLQLRKHDDNVTVRHAELHGDTVLHICRSMLSRVLGFEFPQNLIAVARELAQPTEEEVPGVIELLFAYYRYCFATEAPTQVEATSLLEDLTSRIGRLLESSIQSPAQEPWARVRLIGRNARLARGSRLTAAESRLVRSVALRRGYQLLKAAVRARVRAGLGLV